MAGRSAPSDSSVHARPPEEITVLRTHEAGALRAGLIDELAGSPLTLAGWVARRRDHGGVAFLDLRDASGVVQVVVRDEAVAHDLRAEYVLRVTGQLRRRPEGNENPALPTGEVEVVADTVEVLNRAAALPFQVDEHVEVGEEARLRYRYLDLRRPAPAAALRLRSEVNRAAREVLHGHRFVEIETPTLTRSTPEGARDFVVPPALARLLVRPAAEPAAVQAAAHGRRDGAVLPDRTLLPRRGLPRRPAAGVHPARRGDELRRAGRRDRRRRGRAGRAVAARRPRDHDPIRRLTYADAMDRYGSDKPDLRFGLELVECTPYFAGTPFRVFQAPYVGAVVMPAALPSPASSSTPGRSGPSSAAPVAWRTCWSARTASSPAGGEEPLRGRAGRPGRAGGRGAGGLRVLRGGERASSQACSVPLGSRSGAGRD
jgi:aspartyl-tRNA synthetase